MDAKKTPARELIEDIYDQMDGLDLLPQHGNSPAALNVILNDWEIFEATVEKFREAVQKKLISVPEKTPCGKTIDEWIKDRISELV